MEVSGTEVSGMEVSGTEVSETLNCRLNCQFPIISFNAENHISIQSIFYFKFHFDIHKQIWGFWCCERRGKSPPIALLLPDTITPIWVSSLCCSGFLTISFTILTIPKYYISCQGSFFPYGRHSIFRNIRIQNFSSHSGVISSSITVTSKYLSSLVLKCTYGWNLTSPSSFTQIFLI